MRLFVKQLAAPPGVGDKLFDALGGLDVAEPRILSCFKEMSRLTAATSPGPAAGKPSLTQEPHLADAHFIELSLKATVAGTGKNSLVIGLLEHLMGLSSVNVSSTWVLYRHSARSRMNAGASGKKKQGLSLLVRVFLLSRKSGFVVT